MILQEVLFEEQEEEDDVYVSDDNTDSSKRNNKISKSLDITKSSINSTTIANLTSLFR